MRMPEEYSESVQGIGICRHMQSLTLGFEGNFLLCQFLT